MQKTKNKKVENRETNNEMDLINEKILDSILDDDDEAFIAIISQMINNSNQITTFKMTKYKMPQILSNNPTYSSLCAFFGAEKCFSALTIILPGGIYSTQFYKKDQKGLSTVHFAFAGGNLNIIRTLEQANFSFTESDNQRQTPSHYAAMSNNTDCLKYLWTKGFDILCKKLYITPLHIACLYGQIENVKFLVEKVSKDNDILKFKKERWKKDTPLHFACMSGNAEIVKYLLSKKKFVENQKNELNNFSKRPLNCAIENGSLECVKLLINDGNIKLGMNSSKYVPIVDAAAYGYIDIVDFLLKQKNIEINIKNSKGMTALDSAIINDHFNIVKLLFDNGITRHFDNSKISATFLLACENENMKIIEYLDNVLNIPYDTDGNSFMKQAILLENENLVSFLLGKNCTFNDIGISLNLGNIWTAFMNFLEKKGGKFKSTKNFGYLLTNGNLPLKAVLSGDTKLAQELIDEGLLLTKEMIEDHKCIEYACESGNLKLFDFLLTFKPKLQNEHQLCDFVFDLQLKTIKSQLPSECLKLADKLFSLIDDKEYINTLAINAIYQGFEKFLYICSKYSMDFVNYPLNYSLMIENKHLQIFYFLEENGCKFTNDECCKKMSPLSMNMNSCTCLCYDVKTLIFLMKYATEKDLEESRCQLGNIIDLLFNNFEYNMILYVYKKLNKVFYPLKSPKSFYLKAIRESSNIELIDFILNE